MCKYQRWIVNKYNGKPYLVNCGKCSVCLQQKADKRANLLRLMSLSKDYTPYFVTLTYSNDFVPYIKFSETPFNRDISLDDFIIRIYRNKSFNFHSHTLINNTVCISHKYINYNFDDCLLDGRTKFNNYLDNDKIPILFYSDIQKFIKRLRSKYDIPFYSVAGEYGANTFRPHFHLLLYCDKHPDINFYWQYGFNFTQVAIDVSSYLASYINSNLSGLHPFLKRFFPQIYKRSNSLVRYHIFNIKSIFKNFVDHHTTVVNYSFMTANKLEQRSIFLPIELLNYYFPNNSLFKYITSPFDFYNILKMLVFNEINVDRVYHYSQNKPIELFNHPFVVSPFSMYVRLYLFSQSLGISILDYIIFMFDYLKCRYSEMFRYSYDLYGIDALLSSSPDIYYFFRDDLLNFCHDFNLDVDVLKKRWYLVNNLDYEDFSVYLCNDFYYLQRFKSLDKFHKIQSNLVSLQSLLK